MTFKSDGYQSDKEYSLAVGIKADDRKAHEKGRLSKLQSILAKKQPTLTLGTKEDSISHTTFVQESNGKTGSVSR